ncbi:MAG: hypothetical protein N2C14_34030 [Planctomycetales bacterium]
MSSRWIAGFLGAALLAAAAGWWLLGPAESQVSAEDDSAPTPSLSTEQDGAAEETLLADPDWLDPDSTVGSRDAIAP